MEWSSHFRSMLHIHFQLCLLTRSEKMIYSTSYPRGDCSKWMWTYEIQANATPPSSRSLNTLTMDETFLRSFICLRDSFASQYTSSGFSKLNVLSATIYCLLLFQTLWTVEFEFKESARQRTSTLQPFPPSHLRPQTNHAVVTSMRNPNTLILTFCICPCKNKRERVVQF